MIDWFCEMNWSESKRQHLAFYIHVLVVSVCHLVIVLLSSYSLFLFDNVGWPLWLAVATRYLLTIQRFITIICISIFYFIFFIPVFIFCSSLANQTNININVSTDVVQAMEDAAYNTLRWPDTKCDWDSTDKDICTQSIFGATFIVIADCGKELSQKLIRLELNESIFYGL